LKILIVHQYYLAAGEPGGSRFNELARIWTNAGHQVSVIAGTLNYATSHQAGRGSRWISCGDEDGIRVWRCHVPSTYNRSYLGRMWAFLGFTLAASVAAVRAPRADVVIATSPPLTAAIPGFIAARLRLTHVPWVFEVRDLWPESAITTGVLRRGGLLARVLFALERFACRSADLVNVLTPAFREDLIRRGLVDSRRILFVPNGADVDTFAPTNRDNDIRREYGWGDRFVALYAGAHGRANALMQLVDAADVLRNRSDILIVAVGDGPERLACETAVRDRGLTNIVFLGAQPKHRMPAFVNAADTGLAVLQDNPTFRTVYPNKVFDYMACEKPTVLAIDGVARALVCDTAEAGIFAEPENGRAVARAIAELAEDRARASRLGINGRRWVLANATRSALASRYLEALISLATDPSSGVQIESVSINS
jgi:glycosyltransferase involved in cell wall biosynthesis